MVGFSKSPSLKAIRWFVYGYRREQVPIPDGGPIKDKTKLVLGTPSDQTYSPPVLTSLGPHVIGAAPPHCDPQHDKTAVAGVKKRILAKPPTPNRALRRRFRRFCKRWIKQNIQPLGPDADPDIEKWLEQTNYPLARKEELRQKWRDMGSQWDQKYHKVKCFIKDETYPEYKHARGIFSRTDEFKCATGPFFKLIENQLYKHPAFIKHVPVADRPEYIKKMLERPGSKYFVTDYTAYESHFTKELMAICEFQLYRHVLQFVPGASEFISLIDLVLRGKNVCQFKWFTLFLMATRMSGEMNTSLGNGFSNLMFMLFLCKERGCTNVQMVVEGDDGLTVFKPGPSPSHPYPSQNDFAKLGLTIKLEVHDQLSSASFCGIIFDPEDCINITDPIQAILDFGYTTSVYRRSSENRLKILLRCKALSMAHQYPGCPILQSMAQYALRMTRSYDVSGFVKESRHFSEWDREQLLQAVKDERKLYTKLREPGLATRILMENKYGITIEEQRILERYFNSMTELKPLTHPLIYAHTNAHARDYYFRFGAHVSKTDKSLDFPPLEWPLSNTNKYYWFRGVDVLTV